MYLAKTIQQWLQNVNDPDITFSLAWLYVYVAPVCFIIESAITYIFVKYIVDFKANAQKEKCLKSYWLFMALKTFVILASVLMYLLGGDILFGFMPRVMLAYYFYTLVIIVLTVYYVVVKCKLKSNTSK